MKAYKGFNPDMTCRGFKFEEGKTYTEDKAELCKSGFHACLDPLEVLRHYEPCDSEGNLRKYHEVELEDVDDKREDDTKVCGKKITIGAELNFADLAKAHVEYVKEHLDGEKSENATGDCSAATNTGYCSAATNTGNYSAATNTGNYSVAVAWGRESKAKAAKGSYIVLAEYGEWNGKEYPLLHAKMKKVDGKTIKADTFYRLKDGKFVEVQE
nr:MAG TPA: hypothetical protein [Bacteriophage sp.]